MTRLFAAPGGGVRIDGIAARCDWVVLPGSGSGSGPASGPELGPELGPEVDPEGVLRTGRLRPPGQPLTVFLCCHRLVPALEAMVALLPRIAEPFVLVSASTDATLPRQVDARMPPFGPAEQALVARILAHPHLRRWYAENLDRGGQGRLSPLPLGMVLPQGCPPGGVAVPAGSPLAARPLRVLCAQRVRAGPQWDLRRRVGRLARGPWAGMVTHPEGDLSEPEFHHALACHGFVLCVEGGGLDPSPKAWTALLHGAVPIIRRSALAPAYGLLPVVIVPRWTPDALTPARLEAWHAALAPWFDDPARRAQVLERLGLEFWWRLIVSGRSTRQAGAALALDAEAQEEQRAQEGARYGGGGPGETADRQGATGPADEGQAKQDRTGKERAGEDRGWNGLSAGGRTGPGGRDRAACATSGRPGSGRQGPGRQGPGGQGSGGQGLAEEDPGREAPVPAPGGDPLATPAGRADVARALLEGLAHLEDIFGFAFPAPDRALLAARCAAPACAGADRFHAAALSALFAGFEQDRDGFAGLAAHLSAHVPASTTVAQTIAGAAARFGRPDARLLEEAGRRLQVRAPDMLSLARAEGHFHAKINHGAWEDFTHLGLVGTTVQGPADLRLEAFRGPRQFYFNAVLPQLRDCVDCRFLELFEVAFRRFAVAPGEGAARALDGPERSLGVSIVNGDTSYAEATRAPLGLVARGALPGLLAWAEAAGQGGQGQLRLLDGGGMRQLVWQGQLDAFVTAATAGAEAVVFVVPDMLRRIALHDAGPAQYRILVPSVHAHEFWPVVMASVLGQAARLMRRHRRLTVFVQAAVMSLPLIAGLQALAGWFPGLRVRCFDMGQVLDIADPTRLGSRQLTAREDLAAVVAAQRVPFHMATG